jgi:hypothetical protein
MNGILTANSDIKPADKQRQVTTSWNLLLVPHVIESSNGRHWSCDVIELLVEFQLNSVSKSKKSYLDLQAQQGHPILIHIYINIIKPIRRTSCI